VGEQQGQIKTDWLTADWHEREKSKRRRRNVLPDAYRRLSKSEKEQVRAAAKWIFRKVSLLDWGRKMPDEKAGKPVPKPVNLKDQVLPYIQGNWGAGVRKLTLTAVIRHLVGDDTTYFTANSLGDLTILMLDIDCAPDVTGLPWQQGQARETLLTMLLNRGRLVGHRT